MTHILITGGSGFIGRALCRKAISRGWSVTVLSRQPEQRVRQICGPNVRVIPSVSDIADLPAIDHVINLAGEPILAGRWTSARKQRIRESRIELTKQLINALSRRPTKPATLISGSAVGYYGDTGEEICTESQPAGNGFAASLCRDWERAAQPVGVLGIRLCIVRTGIVLDDSGGPLKKMLLPFKLGLGGPIGNGRQWFPWITRDDLCALIFFLIDQPACHGIFNATAPEAVRQGEFAQMLAAQMHRPALLPVPAFVMKALLGEASELLLASQRVRPDAAMQAGFVFQHPSMQQALATLRPGR